MVTEEQLELVLERPSRHHENDDVTWEVGNALSLLFSSAHKDLNRVAALYEKSQTSHEKVMDAGSNYMDKQQIANQAMRQHLAVNNPTEAPNKDDPYARSLRGKAGGTANAAKKAYQTMEKEVYESACIKHDLIDTIHRISPKQINKEECNALAVLKKYLKNETH